MNIYDIAKIAGVSHTTISRVLNNKPGVKKETKEKILKILDDNAYFPNSYAIGLASNQNKIIGILLIDVRNYHHTDTAFHIESYFSQYGYATVIASCGWDESKQDEYVRIMASRNVEGLVLIGSHFQNEYAKKSIKKYFANKPVVIANGYLNLSNVCGVLLDEKKAVSEVVDYLVGKGHENIAFFYDNKTISAKNKEQGFLDGIEKNNLLRNKNNILDIESRHDVSKDETEKLLKVKPEITAIIYSEDIMAVGGIKACASLGLKVPEEISIIGFNNSIHTETSTPTITSIDNRSHDTGEQCAKALYAMLNEENVEPVYHLEPLFIIKESSD